MYYYLLNRRKAEDLSFECKENISDSFNEMICQKCGSIIIPFVNGKISIHHNDKKFKMKIKLNNKIKKKYYKNYIV